MLQDRAEGIRKHRDPNSVLRRCKKLSWLDVQIVVDIVLTSVIPLEISLDGLQNISST
jgi:hypothetical protein